MFAISVNTSTTLNKCLTINERNMGKPAATISNFHVCPKTTGTVPHVGGPIVGGAGSVTIGGLPAALDQNNLNL